MEIKARGKSGQDKALTDLLATWGATTLRTDPTPEAVAAVLDNFRAFALNGASPIQVEVAGAELQKILKSAGCPAPARLVGAALKIKGDDSAEAAGQQVVLKDPEPWPEPVDGAELLADQARTLRRFLALPPGGATADALWTLHAHAHDASPISPILVFLSAVMRCGKTTALHVLGALVPRPLPAANITPAALFRVVEKARPTLLVDEADSFMTRSDELRGILNSGHTKAGAMVVRTVGDDYEPRIFRTWAPKAIALIGRLPATLEDRAILIEMRRRKRDEDVERLRLDRLAELEPLRRKAARWARDHADALKSADPEVPAELGDRAADNWRPLLAIADLAGGPWPERARRAAVLLAGAVDEGEQAAGIQLLADLRALFDERGADKLASADITEALAKMEDRPWPEWKRGHPITTRQVARLVRPFGIRPKVLRDGDKTPRGYELADFDDAFLRYIPVSDPQQAQQSNNDGAKPRFSDPQHDPDVADSKKPENPHHDCDVADVADRKGGLEEKSHGGAGARGHTANSDANRNAPATPLRRRRVPSRSEPGLYHLVTAGPDGLTCGCKGFTGHGRCRHVDETCPGCLGGKGATEPLCSTCRRLGVEL